jgi:hypothetical protein
MRHGIVTQDRISQGMILSLSLLRQIDKIHPTASGQFRGLERISFVITKIDKLHADLI